MNNGDTIVALSTPAGRGAIAIIRVSGSGAHRMLRSLFRPFGGADMTPNMLTLGEISADGIRDKVMAVIFRAPRSYTGEDMAEVHCHGSPEIAARIIRGFIACGARAAQPGEFTRRAFLGGKLTLDEAEAVGDMIAAQSQAQINAAYDAMRGRLSADVAYIYNLILDVVSACEAAIDYPEEDVEEQTEAEAREKLTAARGRLEALVATYDAGEKVRGGVKVAIIGVPNAGKSSLLNRLLGRERAIVTANAGTTRDTVEESYEYRGVLFTLVDTAGLRAAEDEAERAGVKRSAEAAKTAHIVLRVTDLTRPAPAETETTGTVIEVYNKTDASPDRPTGGVCVSALTGEGIEELREKIYEAALGEGVSTDGGMLTGARHYELALAALSALSDGLDSLGSAPPDCVLVDLRRALHLLGGITGASATDDVLDSIFSRFCVGK